MPAARALLALLVALGYGLVGWSLAVAPVTPWVLLGAALAVLVVVNLGVGFLNLGVFVDVLSRGPRDRRAVALTFDDGPHPVHTREVLRVLREHRAKATFFVIGHKVDRHPEVVEEILADGHEVGLHSHAHDHYLNLRHEPKIVEDIERNQAALERLAGRKPTLFRPPVGLTSPRITVAVRKLGLRVVGWSARAFDGAGRPEPEVVLSRLTPDLKPGAIVLLHDAAERTDERPTSLDALPGLLRTLEERGLEPVTVSELAGEHPSFLAAAPRSNAAS
ncbi:MAG: polysaccharide deacetylase family protein [Myxococcales bacterium]|nr:polysaccharide deacetylase family protein [Myxococcales bacterium]